jgi:hypothetical protein
MQTQRSKSVVFSTIRNATLCLFISGFAQQAAAQGKVGAGLVGTARLEQEKETPIVSFSPIYNNGKTFVRWLVQNDEKDGLFIVERSSDGTQFEALGFKDRVGSALCVNLFYSFIDEEPISGVNYYRLMSVGTDQTYTYSDVVRVRTDVVNTSNPSNSALIETGK